MTHSLDFRRHVFKVMETEGLTMLQTVKKFAIGMSSLIRWKHRLEPKTTRNVSFKKIDPELLAKDVTLHPDSFIYERAQRFGVSKTSMHEALKRLGVTLKKNPLSPKGLRRHTSSLPGEDQGL